MSTLLIALVLVLAPFTIARSAPQQPQAAPMPAPSINDEALWAEFAQWAETLKHVPVDETTTRIDVPYISWLLERGVSKDEAAARYARINVSRRGSVERERLFWNVVWKIDPDAAPDRPLRLLQEVAKDLKPGRALVPGMGQGRNAIYLASVGWDVTGYDNAQAALTAASENAKKAGVTIKAVLAGHDDFDFGTEQWDLIVNSYNFLDPLDPKLPQRLERALRPSGLIVWQSGGPASTKPGYYAQLVGAWQQFRVLRLEQPEGKSDDWLPNQPFFRLVLKRNP